MLKPIQLKKLVSLAFLMTFSLPSLADCAIVITNPKLDNAMMANTCLDFDDNSPNIEGLCRPDWRGMNVSSQTVALCRRATQGSCRLTVQLGNNSVQYVAHYYNTPYTTAAGHQKACLQGGGDWLVD